jgi:hypothetical protein
MRESEVGTYGRWWGGVCLSRDIRSNPGIVVDSMIKMLVKRRAIIGVITVLQVLQLTLCGDVFDGYGHILPVLVCPMISTSSIRW